MKLIKKFNFIGTCRNIFSDDEDGDCLIDLFTDFSDFARKEESSVVISRENFLKHVNLDSNTKKLLDEKSDLEFATMTYSHVPVEGVIFCLFIYDPDDDIHYFFTK